jgi:hypothetical protein
MTCRNVSSPVVARQSNSAAERHPSLSKSRLSKNRSLGIDEEHRAEARRRLQKRAGLVRLRQWRRTIRAGRLIFLEWLHQISG